MARWDHLSPAEISLLQTVFWSAGSSRHVLSGRLDFSKSKVNALVAGLLEQGVLEETGLQNSSGGRRPESLRLSSGLGVLIGFQAAMSAFLLIVNVVLQSGLHYDNSNAAWLLLPPPEIRRRRCGHEDADIFRDSRASVLAYSRLCVSETHLVR